MAAAFACSVPAASSSRTLAASSAWARQLSGAAVRPSTAARRSVRPAARVEFVASAANNADERRLFGQEAPAPRSLSALEKFLVFHQGSESTHLPDGYGWGAQEESLLEHLEASSAPKEAAAAVPALTRLEEYLFTVPGEGMFPDGLSVPGMDPFDYSF